MIDCNMLDKIEDVLKQATQPGDLDIQINSVIDYGLGWLVLYRASDQSWAYFVAYLTQSLKGYKLHWHMMTESEFPEKS
jgi:hypothetical protein